MISKINYNKVMSFPCFKISLIEPSNLDQLGPLLNKLELGLHPIIIVIKDIDEFVIPNVLETIQNYFLEKNISFFIPYPTYIVTPVFNDQVGIKQFKSIQEVPKFFNLKDRRLSSLEQAVLNKNLIIEKRLMNVLKEHHLSLLQDLMPKLRQLKLEINKHQYLENILQNLKNKAQINEWKKQNE